MTIKALMDEMNEMVLGLPDEYRAEFTPVLHKLRDSIDPDEPAGECHHDYLHHPTTPGEICLRCGTVEGENQIVRDHSRKGSGVYVKQIEAVIYDHDRDGDAKISIRFNGYGCSFTVVAEITTASDLVQRLNGACRKYDPADVGALMDKWFDDWCHHFPDYIRPQMRVEYYAIIAKLEGGAE